MIFFYVKSFQRSKAAFEEALEPQRPLRKEGRSQSESSGLNPQSCVPAISITHSELTSKQLAGSERGLNIEQEDSGHCPRK